MTPPRCKIGFANESQFLVVNQSSIDDVETRMETVRTNGLAQIYCSV
jgi:hypothetical protein